MTSHKLSPTNIKPARYETELKLKMLGNDDTCRLSVPAHS